MYDRSLAPLGEVRVLLVEDDDGDAEIIRSEMERAAGGPLVVRVPTLSDAVQARRSGPVDVVLLDLTLPDARRLDALAGIRDEAPDVPVIVLTGLDDTETAMRAIRLGAQDYLLKGEGHPTPVVRAISYAIERQGLVDEVNRLETEAATNRSIRELDRLAGEAATSVTARLYEARPLREAAPEQFAGCVDVYARVVDGAWRSRRYQVPPGDPDTEALDALAESLGALGASPRDVADLHREVLMREPPDLTPRQLRARRAESQWVILALMGRLAGYYRRHSLAGRRPGGNPRAEDP